MTPTVLGLLQNSWAHDPVRVRATLDRQTPYCRRRMIAFMLMRSVTGKRLRSAFGEWCDRIVWENASRVIVGRSHESAPADVDHVSEVILDVKPTVILVFGRIAMQGVAKVGGLLNGVPQIIGPHPAARGPDTMERLVDMRQVLEQVHMFKLRS